MKLWFLLLYKATFNSKSLWKMHFTCFLSSLYDKYEHKLQKYMYEPCGWNVNWKYKINMIVKIHKAIRGNTVVWKILLVKGYRRLAMCGRRNNVDVKLFRTKKNFREWNNVLSFIYGQHGYSFSKPRLIPWRQYLICITHAMRCGHLVYCLEKLTHAKINLMK